MSTLPLAGVRVIDLTRILSGPFCSMILADLGAEVIKIESPGDGDPVRTQGAIKDGLSWYFAGYNRNKKSIAINLRTPEGRALLARLLKQADVLVENYRPGVLETMGFGEDRLKQINPALVHGGITGFGTSGPYRDRPSFDFIAQAMTGFMSLNGPADQPPMRAAAPISDLVAGLYTALSIVAVLARRNRSGEGGTASVSLNGGMMSLLSYLASNYLATGVLPQRTGNDHPIVAPYGLFRTADGEIAIAPSNDTFYLRLIDAIGAAELRGHPDFRTNDKRVERRAQINAAIEARTRLMPSEHWIDVLNAAGVPCSRVMTLKEVFEDPQTADQRAVVSIEHPGHGTVSMLGSPIQIDGEFLPARLPAPELGQHTAEVLKEFGLGEAELSALREKGVIA